MASYILDADAIIDLLLGIDASAVLIRGLFEQGDRLCTCDVVVAEIYAGLHERDRERAEHLIGTLTYLPGGRVVARGAGRWRYAFMRQGQTLSITDCLIAATAVSHGAGLVTGNVKDFPMPELTVLPLPRARNGGL